MTSLKKIFIKKHSKNSLPEKCKFYHSLYCLWHFWASMLTLSLKTFQINYNMWFSIFKAPRLWHSIWLFIQCMYVSAWIYGVLRYLSSIIILTTTRDHAPCACPETHPYYIADNLPFDCKTFVWKSKLCLVMSCASLGPRHSPTHIIMSRIWHSSIGTTFNVSSFDAVIHTHKYKILSNVTNIYSFSINV